MHLSASPGSKNLKKRVQNGPKLKHRTSTRKGHLALLECQLAQIRASAQGHLDWNKKKNPFLFFLEIKMRPNLYSDHLANFSNIPTSIKRVYVSKINTLFHAL